MAVTNLKKVAEAKIVSYLSYDKDELGARANPGISENTLTTPVKATITYNHPSADPIIIRAAKRYFFTNNDKPSEKLDATYALTTQVTVKANYKDGSETTINPTLALSNDKKELSITISEEIRLNSEIDSFTIEVSPKGLVKGVILHDTKDNGDKDFSKNIYAKTISDLVDDVDSINKFVTQAEKERIGTNETRIGVLEGYFDRENPSGVRLNVAVPAQLVVEDSSRVFVSPSEKTQITTNQEHIASLERKFVVINEETSGGTVSKLYLSYEGAGLEKDDVYVRAANVVDTSERRFVTDSQIDVWTNQRVSRLVSRNDYVQNGYKYAYSAIDGTEGKTKIVATEGEAGTLVERNQYGQVISAPSADYIPASDSDLANSNITKYVEDETAEDGYREATNEDAEEVQRYVRCSPNAAVTKGVFDSRIENILTDIEAQLATKENLANKSNTIYLENEAGYNTANLASDSVTKYPSVKAVRDALDDVREVAYGKTTTYVASYVPEVPAVYEEEPEDPENPAVVTPAVPAVNEALNRQDELVQNITSLIADEGDGHPVEVINKLKIGDVIYLTNTELPDRWVSAIAPTYTEVTTTVDAKSSIGLYLRSGEEGNYTYTKVTALSDYVKGATYYREGNTQVSLRIMETAKVNIARIDLADGTTLTPNNQIVTIPYATPTGAGIVKTGTATTTSIEVNNEGVISVLKADDNAVVAARTGITLTGGDGTQAPPNSVITVDNLDAAVASALIKNDYIAADSEIITSPQTGTNHANRFKEWMHISEVTANANATSQTSYTPEDPDAETETPDNDNQTYLKSITISTGSQAGQTYNIKPVEVYTFPDTDMVKRIAVGNKIYNIQPGRIGYEELEWEE